MRYRIEVKIDKNNYFRVDCTEENLEYWKAICKYDAIKNNGECYYREFPVSKNKKIYYAKGEQELNANEIKIIVNKLEKELVKG